MTVLKIKLRSDALLKFLFKIRLKRETNLMQACSANQHQVIMPSWLPKVPSWLRKNALCLGQSAFSNFALHVIKLLNGSVTSLKYSANILLLLLLSYKCDVIWTGMFLTPVNLSFRMLKRMQLLFAEVGSFLDPSWLHARRLYCPRRHT